MPDAEPARRGRPPRLSVDERREAILDAAREQFASGGRDATTMAAVAAGAGLQKPSVYRLYPSKDELFRATVDREVDRFATWVEELYRSTGELDLDSRIRARARGVVRYVATEPAGMALLSRALRTWPDEALPAGIALRARVLDVLARFAADEGRQAGVELGPAADALAAITFGMTQAVVELASEDGRWSLDVLGDLLAESAVAVLTRSDPAVVVALGAQLAGDAPPPG